jgi:hypothetical protein
MMCSATFTAFTTTALALLLAALALLLVVSAATGATPAPRVVHVSGGIEAIAMDGRRIAYEENATRRSCDRIFVLNVVTGTRKRVGGCRPDYGGRELAIAGRRLAWIISSCGNNECDDDLATASLPGLRARSLAHAHSEGEVDADELEGTFIHGLVGSGKLLAVNRWTGYVSGGMITMTQSGLDLIGTKGLRRVASGPNTTFAQSADSGRIAVLRGDGSVGIYSASGKLLLEVKPGPVDDEQGDPIALRGDHLLVFTNTRRLEIYNSHSGALLHSWPVPEGATSLDAYAGAAAYVAGGGPASPYKLHDLRLTTGKDVVLAGGKFQLFPHSIEIEAPGLVYAKDTRTLVFVPLRRVLAGVS